MKKGNNGPRVAVVTGSDRGIGFEICRQLGRLGYRIVLTSPDPKRGRKAAAELAGEGINVVCHVLDITSEKHVQALREFILSAFGRVDVLVNNAGVMLDVGHSKVEGTFANKLRKRIKNVDYGEAKGILEADMAIVRATLEINTLGALRMCQAFVPLMMQNAYGRVVNVSSRLGQLAEMSDGYTVPAYQMSKTALNAVTRLVADAASGHNVAVNSVCPGWTRTDLGGPRAPQTPAEAADTIVWLATQKHATPTGGFYAERRAIEW